MSTFVSNPCLFMCVHVPHCVMSPQKVQFSPQFATKRNSIIRLVGIMMTPYFTHVVWIHLLWIHQCHGAPVNTLRTGRQLIDFWLLNVADRESIN
jgi:hypothetical protein